jgi:hypothetical protein
MEDPMDRRLFIQCLGGGCALALAGCAANQDTQADTMTDAEAVADVDRSEWDIAVCGINCAKCGLLKEGKCGGCRGPLEQHWSANCTMLACAQSKGLRYCFECDEFPCEILAAFAHDGYDHHRQTVENLKAMRAQGLAQWIAQQPEPLFCPGWKP